MQPALAQPKDVINTMKSIGVVPVFYNNDVNTILQVIKLSYRSGLHVFEFLHQRDNRGLRIFSWLVEQTAGMTDLRLGVGTVLDAVMAERYIEAGAQFIASPFLRKDMAEVCLRHNVLWMPGCSTQQDIIQAQELGAKAVIILPGNILDPEFLRKAVIEYPELSFVPSGGMELSENNLRGWVNAGAMSVRVSDSLFQREAIAIKDWARIESTIHNVIRTIQKLKMPGRKNTPLNIVL